VTERGDWWSSRVAAVAAVGFGTALVGLHALLYGRWIVDDAGITFAYVRSIAIGAGPVLQPGGELVEGYSNPAWLALLLAGRWLGIFDRGAWFGVPDYVAFPKLLALVLVALTFACCHVVASVTSKRPALITAVVGAVTAAVPSFVIWTMSGLENSLLALSVAALAAVLARASVAGRLLALSTAVPCGLLAALAALTRPDGLIYVAAYPLVLLLLARPTRVRPWVSCARAAAASLAAAALPVAAYELWRYATFGALVPNTAVAKAQGLPGQDALARPGEIAGYVGWFTALLAAALVGVALFSRGGDRPWPGRRGLAALLVPLTLAVSAFAVLEPDWMGHLRFATPVWPLGALATAISAQQVLPRLGLSARTVVVLGAMSAALASGVVLSDAARAFRAAPTAPLCLVAQNAGRNIAGYEAIVHVPSPSLLAPDVGGAALASGVRIVDLAGLADEKIARFWRVRDWPGLRDHVLVDVRPTFVKSHGPWSAATGLPADPRFAADYVEIGTTSGTTDWIRRDVLAPGELEELQRFHAEVAAPADITARAAPRSSCGEVLRPRLPVAAD
jgi:hypothetical protein